MFQPKLEPFWPLNPKYFFLYTIFTVNWLKMFTRKTCMTIQDKQFPKSYNIYVCVCVCYEIFNNGKKVQSPYLNNWESLQIPSWWRLNNWEYFQKKHAILEECGFFNSWNTHWSAPRCECILKLRNCFFTLKTSGHFSVSDNTRGRDIREDEGCVSFPFVLPDVKWTQCQTQTAGLCLSAIRSRWQRLRLPDITHTSSLISVTNRTKCKSLRLTKVLNAAKNFKEKNQEK